MPSTQSLPRQLRIAPWLLGGLLVLAVLLSMGIGAYTISWAGLVDALLGQASSMENFLVWQVRLPRTVLALLVGGGLAVAGATAQGLFRNPLAEPTLIGITSGAMLFAVTALVLGQAIFPGLPDAWQQLLVSIAAFVGALLTTFLVYQLAQGRGKLNVATLLLAGIAVTSLASAGTGLLMYFSSESELRDITFWTLGSLAGATWEQIVICAPVIGLGSYFLHKKALLLNAFLLGEREAHQLGFSVTKAKREIIVWMALTVGVCISLTGLIGFVGLVIPHILRLALGTDYRRLLGYSLLLGGGFLLLTDAMARTIVAPAELPIGILTAMVGAPFFIWLLVRQRSKNTFSL